MTSPTDFAFPGRTANGTTHHAEVARAELRARQGAGARYDSTAAPAQELSWARLGTAYFARRLNDLTGEELAQPSLLAGWSRAELIAHVGYNARALTRLVQWARTGVENPMYFSQKQRSGEILLGGTLPMRALRNLFSHSQIHLNVEWRDLADEHWDREVVTAQGRVVPARETAWMRAREVWIHAVDLGNGGSFHDFPADYTERLIADVLATWARRGEAVNLTLRFEPSGELIRVGSGGPVVSGLPSDIARWLTGRGARNLGHSVRELPTLPYWI